VNPSPAENEEIAALKAEVESLKARLAQAEMLADRDPLAPLLNRRAFVRELSRTLAYCERYGTEASLIYFDLDGFKAVNDRFGHAAGDAALSQVAAILITHVRESDIVGRIGGDEFAVVLAEAGPEAATVKAALLAAEIHANPAGYEGRAITLSISWGVRGFEPDLSATRMLAEADAAMFLAKGKRPAV
jgi:diguanylate cyclase (GGDEF)-like protein